ncbi:MAG: murein hydrolase activator EnvC family protein [Oscillospiraceae bacterium]
MNRNQLAKKIVSFAAALCMTFGIMSNTAVDLFADTQSDLEARQAELAQQRKEVEKDLAKYKGEAQETEEYLAEYDKKMKIQEDQIANIDDQIKNYQDKLDELSIDIEEHQAEVDEGVEQFRKRLRSIYISGNDSYASLLVGATDFYGILARLEFAERISKHDNDMIEDLKSKITVLENDKADYEEKLAKQEALKAKEEEYYAELSDTYNNHAETKAMQDAMLKDYMERFDEIVADQQKVEEELQAEIRRKQEEAERRRKEEEERRRKEEEERKKQAEANGETYTEQDVSTFTSYSETGFIWPAPTVRNISPTDNYGERYLQEEGRYDFHKGMDITKPGCYGEPIVASAAGEVLIAGDTGNGYGKHVVIDHGNSISTLYGHCSSLAVKVGDIVEQGQVIGYIGSTGYAYGNHLHFEVRINGQHTDPNAYVNINN